MVDRPIVFSAPMVRALLAGRKTQTRRIIRDDVTDAPSIHALVHEAKHDAPYLDAYCNAQRSTANPRRMSERWCWWTRDDRQCLPTFRVGYMPGDRLWVREAHAGGTLGVANVIFRAEHEEAKASGPRVDVRWRPSIHMFREASRLTLAVTDVRVQRLQNISEEDAEAEGCEFDIWDQVLTVRNYGREDGWYCMWGGPKCFTDPDVYRDEKEIWRASFQSLWNSLHGAEAWAANPWVAALTFTVSHANIDAPLARELADA